MRLPHKNFAKTTPGGGNSMNARVFVIDDVETTRALIRMLLRGASFDIVGEAGTLLTALQKVTSLRPDVVILDLEMPDGNGINLISQLRDINPDVRIVVASAHSDSVSVEAALHSGADGFVIKPFTAGTLENALARALKRGNRSSVST